MAAHQAFDLAVGGGDSDMAAVLQLSAGLWSSILYEADVIS